MNIKLFTDNCKPNVTVHGFAIPVTSRKESHPMEQPIKTLGIIAEYNPFHNGHRHQIEEIRRRTGAKIIIAVMGGNFLQRGTPAMADKYLRTEMALSCGADFVIELPTVFATASAEFFAYGGVSLLHRMGCVDGICFGSECGNLAPLTHIADFLCQEPENYREQLRSLVAAGVSYPAARSQILSHRFPEIFHTFPDLLTAPNNILAIEYLKALRQLNSPLVPLTLPRSDLGYHAGTANGQFLSASAIRSLMTPPGNGQTENAGGAQTEDTMNAPTEDAIDAQPEASLAKYLPGEVLSILADHKNRFPLTADDFSEYLFYGLTALEESQALSLSDISPDLWNRIKGKCPDFLDVSSFAEQLKSKQYTHSRISRVLCHILLQIKKEFLQNSSTGEKIPALYGRILGLDMEQSSFLRNVVHFPLINKVANARQILEEFAAAELSSKEEQDAYLSLAKAHLQVDLKASALYRRALYHKKGTLLPEEHRAGVIRKCHR